MRGDVGRVLVIVIIVVLVVVGEEEKEEAEGGQPIAYRSGWHAI